MSPTTGRWIHTDANTILRVLCHWDDEIADKFLKKTFQLPKRRSLPAESDLEDRKIEVPSLLIMGGKDYVTKFPNIMEYIESKQLKEYIPDLQVKFISDGSHFVQEQFPDEVNLLITSFLRKHCKA